MLSHITLMGLEHVELAASGRTVALPDPLTAHCTRVQPGGLLLRRLHQ
jgi:hypothetical protein